MVPCHGLLRLGILLIAAGYCACTIGTTRCDETGTDEAGMFPFSISYDAPQNAANVSNWLHRPAGKYGFVRTDGGHLVTDDGPIRFWGTNLCFDASFPSRKEAERMAARMARLGINCVRMHHMDAHSIWGKSGNHLTIDPEKLERLDYLIYQFKLQGIYTNLNLHVSRWFDEKDGFAAKDGRPQFDKGLDNFEPRMIEMQKRYARDLLAHVNPYTKNAYVDEPAVAMVEINNENSLFTVWSWGKMDDLAEPYATTFRKLWNQWLRDKYGDTASLAKAWNGENNAPGEELIRNGDFTGAIRRPWVLERNEKCKVDWSIQSAPYGVILGTNQQNPEKHPFLRVVVTQVGDAPWVPQLVNGGFPIKAELSYTLTFRMRASETRRLQVNCTMAHEPWQSLGLSKSIEAGPQWRQYRLVFAAPRDDDNARLSFSNFEPGTYELADVSLRSGGAEGLPPGETLENDGVIVLRYDNLSRSQASRRDFIDFLCETDRDYWLGMYRFLKDDLRLRSVVSGTQRGYGPVFPQTKLDYIDAHSYWQHPEFPGREWDANNWTARNTPMVNDAGGTFAELAAWRVWSMPYTVSEYNHPRPNFYADEGFPMIAAFARVQNWDGVFSFAYAHSTAVDPARIEGFFDIRSDTTKLAHMPACAAMLLRGDVQTARTTLLARVTAKMEREFLYKSLSAWGLDAASFGIDRLAPLVHGVAMEIVSESSAGGVAVAGDNPAAVKTPLMDKNQNIFISDTGELRWDISREKAGFFTVNSPRTKFFTGFGQGRVFTLGDVDLKLGKTRLDWATLSLVCLDGKGFSEPGRILIAATGMSQNRGAQFRKTPQGGITLGADWGGGPVLCEGVEAEITLPVEASRVNFYPLDESGNRRPSVSVADADGRALLLLGPQHKTVWYEVEIR